jgi:hypothetical protein
LLEVGLYRIIDQPCVQLAKFIVNQSSLFTIGFTA